MGRLGSLLCSILFFIFLDIGASKDVCRPSRCHLGGPEIRFPFRRSNRPEHCGYPGFELACRGNDTVINLPTLRDFPVTDISYSIQTLTLESKFCPASLVLNHDVSNSPFHFYYYGLGLGYELENYTFLNCSTANSITAIARRYDYFKIRYEYFKINYEEIHCLSESDNHIFAVPSSLNMASVPKYCSPMKTIPVIRPYSSYLSDPLSIYFRTLKWESPDCASCETGGGTCRRNSSNSLEIMCSNQPQFNLPPDEHRGLYFTFLVFSIGFPNSVSPFPSFQGW